MNLSTVLTEDGAPGLTQTQIFGIALATAYSTKNAALIESMLAVTQSGLGDAEKTAAKSAAIIMAMNNVYYRATHLAMDEELEKLPARLRMNVIGKPGIAKIDFELYSIAISAVNGCGKCISSHVHEVRKAGVSTEAIHSSLRIASVVNAAAQGLSIA